MSLDTAAELHVTFPETESVDQDREWCLVRVGDREERIRFHDYGRIYSIPGLYELIFYEHLECSSPRVVCDLLAETLAERRAGRPALRVLELGAGNGMVGECLRELGVEHLVGVDILDEARMAAERDRPGVYDDYLVRDFTTLTDDDRAALDEHRFDALVSVAALGFGDIPPLAFAEAFNRVAPGGLVAFNIKADFLHDGEPTGFGMLIRAMLGEGVLEEIAEHEYRHRLSISGEPLNYVAVVARKRAHVPPELIPA